MRTIKSKYISCHCQIWASPSVPGSHRELLRSWRRTTPTPKCLLKYKLDLFYSFRTQTLLTGLGPKTKLEEQSFWDKHKEKRLALGLDVACACQEFMDMQVLRKVLCGSCELCSAGGVV